MIWTLGDRGPNFTCGEAKNVAGVTPATCDTVRNGRVYLTPGYSPSIYRLMLLDDGTFRVTDVITLKDRDGRPLNGMPNPLKATTTEIPMDGKGKPCSSRTSTASTPKASCGSPTARSGSATRTAPR